MQREDQTDHGNGPGTNSSEGAVNHLSKSVVRESRTPRSMGTGGGRPLPVTRSGPRQRSPATRLMALVLFAQASYGEVLRCLLEGWLHLKGESTALASKSAITKARIRLGVAPLTAR